MRLAAALLALSLAACGSPEERAADHLGEATSFLAAGNDAKAMVEVKNALQLAPKNAHALFLLGQLHERAQRWPHAFAAYQAAVAEDPGLVAAQVKLGNLAILSGDVELAAKTAAAILKAEPANLDGRTLEAAVALRRGGLDEAERLASAVLAQSPTHGNALAVRVGVSSARGRLPEAKALLEDGLARSPKDTALLFLRILLAEQAGERERAAEGYARLLELEPGNLAYRRALAEFHERAGAPERAVATLREGLDRGGAEALPLLDGLAALLERTGGPAAAEAELRRRMALLPDSPAPAFLLAELLARSGRSAEAKGTLEDLAAGAKAESVAHDAKAALARLALSQGDPAGARGLADAVLAKDPEHRDANLARAAAALAAGDAEEAIRSGRAALRQNPDWAPGLRLIAGAHLKKGEDELAAQALRKLLDAEPGDLEALGRLAGLLAARGELEQAAGLWGKAIAAAGAEPPAAGLAARAAIRLEQRRWAEAEAEIDRLGRLPGQAATAALLEGRLELARGRPAEAREPLLEAVRLRPDAVEPLAALAASHLAAGDAEAAVAAVRRRAAAAPDDAPAQHLLGEVLAQAGRAEEALVPLRKAVELRPGWVLPARTLGRLLLARGDADGADAVYASALAKTPDDLGLLMDRAGGLLAAGRVQAAIRAYEAVLARHPGEDVAANNLAALIADHEAGDPARLRRAVELAQRFRGSDNPYLLDTLGWALHRSGDVAQAATYLARATGLAPDVAAFQHHLGLALLAGGRKAEAAQALTRALAAPAPWPGRAEAEAALMRLRAEGVQAAAAQ
jgi:predicted Zn-dependent protease